MNEVLGYIPEEKSKEELFKAIIEDEVKPLVYVNEEGQRIEIHHVALKPEEMKEAVKKVF